VSEEAAFLSAIANAPDDDTVRLVYADWLQDRNDPRADYLRLEVKRHRMTPRQRRTEDPFYQLERLRPHATPDWLSRIDRTMRLSMFWPQDVCRHAEQNKRVGQPLARVHSRGNHSTHFPNAMEAGDYLYVFAFRGRLLLVGRMRVERRVEKPISPSSTTTWTSGVEGTEGTPVRFDRPVTDDAMSRLSWFSGKEERGPKLNAEGRLTNPTIVSSVLRLTPRTAADLNALLRGDSLS
jgi:uncharacterized protein (TIGR02996 family)